MKPDSMDALPIPSDMMKALPDPGSAPVFGAPQGQKPKQQSSVASFLGGAQLPQPGQQGKTLTGQ